MCGRRRMRLFLCRVIGRRISSVGIKLWRPGLFQVVLWSRDRVVVARIQAVRDNTSLLDVVARQKLVRFRPFPCAALHVIPKLRHCLRRRQTGNKSGSMAKRMISDFWVSVMQRSHAYVTWRGRAVSTTSRNGTQSILLLGPLS